MFIEQKLKIVELLKQIKKDRRLSQAKLGEILGIDQSKISLILNGNLRSFSLSRLMKFLNMLGYDVFITINPKKGEKGQVTLEYQK